MDIKTARIRALNDGLRQNFADGIAVMTPGIAALGPEAVVVGLSASMWSEIRAPRPSHRVTCGSKFPLPMKTLLLHRCTVRRTIILRIVPHGGFVPGQSRAPCQRHLMRSAALPPVTGQPNARSPAERPV
jgi:hypothetical protein